MNREILLQILDLARWAPSGDNAQPWRFEIVADDRIKVHGFDTRDHVIYDFEGRASHLAHGALIETMAIAASGFGQRLRWSVTSDPSARKPVYQVIFEPMADMTPSPLFPFIETRCVQRRPMSGKLTAAQRMQLAVAAGDDFTIRFLERFQERLKTARLLWRNAQIRLTCPEAFPAHQAVIEWRARFSNDRIPEQAVGVDPVTAWLMRWVMQRWTRVEFFNRYLFGTLLPRLELDLLPAIRCAGHILLQPKRPPVSLEDWIGAGMTMQRLWLTAAQQGLHLQPEMTPVIFRWYVQAGKQASAVQSINRMVEAVALRFEDLAAADRTTPFTFFCRVGKSAPPASRSLRLSLAKLMVDSDDACRAR